MSPFRSILLGSATLAVAAMAAPADAQTRCGADYTVRPGDTLYAIAQQCRVPISRIMDLNPRLDPRAMEVGQELDLVADARGDYRDAPRNPADQREYRVERGDNFSTIAAQLGLSIFELIAANEDLDPFNLQPGDRIEVPVRDDVRGAFSVSPHEGAPGSVVEIDARNLRPNDWVTIGAGPQASEWQPIRQVQVDGEGRLDTNVRVPDWADRGDDLIFVVDTDRGRTLKSDPFDVTARDGREEWRDDDDEWRDDGDRRDEWTTLVGEVSMGTECHVLTTRDGDVYSIVSDDIRFTEGEHVRIRGERADASFCMQGQSTIDVSEIREVRRDDGRGSPDHGEVTLIGEVSMGVECHVLRTESGAVYSLVSDEVRFTEGEHVRIEGERVGMSFCQQGEATIEVNSIRETPRRG